MEVRPLPAPSLKTLHFFKCVISGESFFRIFGPFFWTWKSSKLSCQWANWTWQAFKRTWLSSNWSWWPSFHTWEKSFYTWKLFLRTRERRKQTWSLSIGSKAALIRSAFDWIRKGVWGAWAGAGFYWESAFETTPANRVGIPPRCEVEPVCLR